MRARLKNRRGAVMVMASVMMVVAVLIMAFGMDLSQAYVQANQLQTAADAAAHAGAVQLFLLDTAHVPDSAVALGNANKVLGHTATFVKADVQCGTWDPVALTFTAAATCGSEANAVKASGTDPRQYIFPKLWNLTGRKTGRSAVAWVSPNVVSGACVKPFSIPYTKLTTMLNPDPAADPLRDLTAEDERKLATMSVSELTFTLKTDQDNTVGAGNFSLVNIDGSSEYRANIQECSQRLIEPGTKLQTLTGGRVGPTMQALDSLCATVVNGYCYNSKGTLGVVIKVPLWYAAGTGEVNGTSEVTVKMVATFSLDYFKKSNGGGKTGTKENADVKGHWVRVVESGAIGTSKGTMHRIVLVQ